MERKPLISIITITYNAENELRPTMESVATQSYRNYEHLIIDGASKDKTVSIAQEYPDVRIISEPDKGLYDAMNKGLKLSKGEYVIFLNAGDSFHSSSTLGKYGERAEKGDDIIFGDTVIVDKNRTVISPRHYSVPTTLTKRSFEKGMLICHQAFMVRKSLAPEYDLKYRFSADYDWTIKCINVANMERCTNLNDIVIDYLSDGLTDKNKIKSLKERYRVMASHFGQVAALRRHATLIFGKLLR